MDRSIGYNGYRIDYKEVNTVTFWLQYGYKKLQIGNNKALNRVK